SRVMREKKRRLGQNKSGIRKKMVNFSSSRQRLKIRAPFLVENRTKRFGRTRHQKRERLFHIQPRPKGSRQKKQRLRPLPGGLFIRHSREGHHSSPRRKPG